MKYIFSLLIFLVNIFVLSAQTPMSVLDAVASDYKKSGDVEIGFTLNNLSAGTIKLSGQKFNIVLDEMTMWFNGKTLWTYVHDNMEVNVTNPTSAEIAKINPYAFVTLYKSGYKAEFGGKRQGEHHIILKATDANKSFKQIDLYIAKVGNKLKTVELLTRNSANVVINVNSYKYKKFAESTFIFDNMMYKDLDVIDLR